MKISVKTRVAAVVLSAWALGIASASGADDSRVIRSSGSELGRISYWYGKVNAHKAAGGAWLKDPDCLSGANIDPLTYCRKFFPGTTSVTEVELTAKPSNLWNTAHCGLTYSGNGEHEWICNGESTPARPATSLRPRSTTSPMRSAQGIMDSLKNALNAANPDFNKAGQWIKQIRDTRSVNYVIPLQEQLVRVQEHTVESFELRVNPWMTVQYELEATIISLELDRDKITDVKARGRRLLQRVEVKLNNKQVVNAEMILLNENATVLTDELMSKLFDNAPANANFKAILLAVLSKSADSTIEDRLLQHIDMVESDRLVYAHALFLLSKKGGVNTFNYLQKKMGEHKKEQEPLLLLVLKSLSENTPDPVLRMRIRELIKN